MQRFSKTRKKSIPSQILLWMIFFIPLSYFILLYDAHLFRLYTENYGYWTFEFIGIFALLFSSLVILPTICRRRVFAGNLPIIFCLSCLFLAYEEAGNILVIIFDTGRSMAFGDIEFSHHLSLHSLSPLQVEGSVLFLILVVIIRIIVDFIMFSTVILGALVIFIPHLQLFHLKKPQYALRKFLALPKAELQYSSGIVALYLLALAFYIIHIRFQCEMFFEVFETVIQVAMAIGLLLYFGSPQWGKWTLCGMICFTIIMILLTTNSTYVSFNARAFEKAMPKILSSKFSLN